MACRAHILPNYTVTISLVLLIALSRCKAYNTKSPKDVRWDDPVVAGLLTKIQESQIKEDQPDYRPPVGWQKVKGGWPGEARFNFHGNPAFSLIRDTAYALDNNGFITGWILQLFLESVQFGGLHRNVQPAENLMVQTGLIAFNEFRDQNAVNGSGLVGFWKQRYNATANLWYASPDNFNGLLEFANTTFPWQQVIDLLKKMHKEDDIKIIQSAMDFITEMLYAFHIPTDFDDTFLNLGLGATLKSLSDQKLFPEAFPLWKENNKHITQVFDNVKKYAYHPLFSKNLDLNLIDTRTYFYLHPFISESEKRGEPLAIVTTWVQNLSELKVQAAGGVHMPFNVNNVDLAVCANTVAGITLAFLADIDNATVWFDRDLTALYLNTSAAISYVIDSGMLSQRPDLILLYYPSIYTFYWFVGRTVFTVENELQAGRPVAPALQQAYELLSASLRKTASDAILAKGKRSVEGIYFDDFLGNNDTDLVGIHVNNARDRVYSTAMATNALLRIWTFHNEKTGYLNYIKDVPRRIILVVAESSRWLRRFVLSSEYALMNDFFSGSFKGVDTLDMWYPANYKKFENGTDIPDDDTGTDQALYTSTVGVTGFIDESVYANMLYNQTHFGRKTPLNMTSYNAPDNFFPFWSSKALTYAAALQALSFVDNLVV